MRHYLSLALGPKLAAYDYCARHIINLLSKSGKTGNER